ncbi:hypothetical protein A3860_24380 [Niastella vici]|uniref:Uncharacterized protein n=1 Tax=Niastella vici TaxID=1703345 RepID=A0A1V9FYS6_9BACT|nr:hypothetical protein [Niastella vici]OQP63482.1 hypothetical protein A3860_24380 [Niastella vici]
MKKSTIVVAVLGAFLVVTLIVGYIIVYSKGEDSYNLIRSIGPISKVEITYGGAQGEMITISDRAILDSLNVTLDNLGNSIRVNIAKANDVYAFIVVYKRGKSGSMEVVHSQYTGWVLIVGNYKFKNDYVFGLVQRYLPK